MARACSSTRRHADRRALLAAGALLAASGGCRDGATALGAEHAHKLIVLGVDGMDPALTRRYLAEGRMPNLQRLIDGGGFIELGTTNPPQSPVAWSSFITGLTSAGHGIFDFVHRDPRRMEPYLSTARSEPGRSLSLGPLTIPLSGPRMRLLREGQTFWQTLEAHHHPAAVLTIPANFPPAESAFNVSTAGMGTPDLLGTPGTFQVIATGAEAEKSYDAGIVHAARLGEGGLWRAEIEGPRADPSDHDPLHLPVSIAVVPAEADGADAPRARAVITLGEGTGALDVVLDEGQWSDWLPIAFGAGAVSAGLPGMVRLYAKRLVPEPFLYVSPVNLDPMDPAMALSSPEHAMPALAGALGRFYTQGMPQDTKALSGGVLDDSEFLAQADLVYQESLRQLTYLLDGYRGGLLFFYFSSIDQVSHVFWRSLEEDAAPDDARFAHVLPDLYAQIDGAIGLTMARAGDAPVLIMSDHGFAPYRYKVNLNTWLHDQGFLALAETRGPGPLGHIDWRSTQAYALGLNQLFLNLAGREPQGAVPAEEREVVLERITQALLAWRDPGTGQRVVTRVERPEPGHFPDRAPDLLVGYNRGYRSSDESALGVVQGQPIERNRSKWSGDHCMDPALVPGVLIASRPLAVGKAGLTDLAGGILEHFHVPGAATARPRLLRTASQGP